MKSTIRKVNSLHTSALIAVLTIATSTVAAQEPVDRTAGRSELEEIIVSATRTSGSDKSIPNTVAIIDSVEIDAQRAVSINPADMLSNMIASYSPPRQKLDGVGESFRGRAPLFLIDGVPQSNPLRDGSRDGFTIDMGVVEEIEIIYGANAIQGLGATGGIINYRTVSAPASGELEQRAELGITSDDSGQSDGTGYRASYMAGKRSGQWDFVGSVTFENRGLFYDADGLPVGIGPTQGDVMDSDTANLFAKIGFEPSETQRFQLLINNFELEGKGNYVDVAGDRSIGLPTSSISGREFGEIYSNDVTTVTLNYANTDFLNGKFTGQVYVQDFAGTYGSGAFGIFQDPLIAPVGEITDQSQNNSEKLGVRFTQRYSEVGNSPIDVIFGLDILKDETTQSLIQTGRNWVPETKYNNIAPFVQFDTEIGGMVTIAGGVRYESSDLEVDDYTSIAGNRRRSDFLRTDVAGGNPEFSDTLANIGAVVRPNDNFSFYGMYSQGFAMPDVGRVLRGVSVDGSDVDSLLNLEPIVTDNIEVGVEYDADRFGAKLAWYESTSDFGSRLVLNDGGVFDLNREETEIQGWELSASFAASDIVSFAVSYAALDGRFDSDDDGNVDSDLGANNVSPDRLNVTLDVHPEGRWSGRLQSFTYMSNTFTDAVGAETARFDGYTLVDAMATLELERVRFTFSIANLLDEQYITYFGQAGNSRADRYFAGRGRTLGVRAIFEF